MLNAQTRRFASASDFVPAPAAPPIPPRANGELILVVDDQENIRDLLATVLNDHGYRTLLAMDGDHALGVFKQQADHIAAVITDVHMPHNEGGSFADLLRKLRPDLPILFMSGLEDARGRVSVAPASMDPFLLKPFRPIALLDAIHRLLQRRRTPQV
jgi:CheY-like chemotaxis protein